MTMGDWMGPAVLSFYSGGMLIYTHSSTDFTLCMDQFYQMTGGTFDIDASGTGGNWCLMNLYVEQALPPGPTLAVANLVAGGTVTISVSNCSPNAMVRHGFSIFGGGPTATPYGDVLLTPPWIELPTLITDATGDASMPAPVPNGLAEVIG